MTVDAKCKRTERHHINKHDPTWWYGKLKHKKSDDNQALLCISSRYMKNEESFNKAVM